MHGSGTYTDTQGLEWEGVFINGTFDSTIQKRLRAEYEEEQKLEQLGATGKEVLQAMKAVFTGDKKWWKDQFLRFVVTAPDEVDKFVAGPYPRWEDRTGDRWHELVTQLLDVEPRALRDRASAQFIADTRIFAEQMSGAGQIVEFAKQIDARRIELGLVLGEGDRWQIVHAVDMVAK